MLLTPTEMERLTIYTAAELARKRRARGLKLNHPEAIALIADEILEGGRDGRSVAELISFGSTILTTDDVQPGVAEPRVRPRPGELLLRDREEHLEGQERIARPPRAVEELDLANPVAVVVADVGEPGHELAVRPRGEVRPAGAVGRGYGVARGVMRCGCGVAVAGLTADIARGRVSDGFVTAIELCGGVLATHFPPGSNDKNELPNRLIVLK